MALEQTSFGDRLSRISSTDAAAGNAPSPDAGLHASRHNPDQSGTLTALMREFRDMPLVRYGLIVAFAFGGMAIYGSALLPDDETIFPMAFKAQSGEIVAVNPANQQKLDELEKQRPTRRNIFVDPVDVVEP